MPVPEQKIGWYVEVPSELVKSFEAVYPYRGAKVDLTLLALYLSLGREDDVARYKASLQRGSGGSASDSKHLGANAKLGKEPRA